MNKLFMLLAKNKRQAQPHPIEMKGDEATLYIYDAIVSDDITASYCGGVSAESLVPQIRAVKGGTLRIRINSPGGDVFAAQAIVSAIRDTKAKVIAHIDGFAASAATVIATAAHTVEISDGALYMIHCGWTMALGNASDMRETANLLDKVDATIVSQYAKRTGKTPEQIKALMDAETWMDATECVANGFADAISEAVDAKAQWDLSAYANAPAAKPNSETSNITPEHRQFLDRKLRLSQLAPHQ